jgi:O-antigen/teichoic acid export membrane protein
VTSPTKQLIQRVSGRVGRYFGRNSRKSTLALLDQVVVGGTSLLTTIVVGRVCGAEELGVFTLGLSIMILAIVAQEALITTPFTINVSRFRGAGRRRYTAGVMAHFAIHALLFGSVVAVAAALVTLTGLGPSGMAATLWALTLAIPFRLLRELARRLSYADMNTRAALAVGVVTAVLQLTLLVLLAALGMLSATTALALVGFSAAVSGIGWFLVYRPPLRCKRRLLVAVARRNSLAGKWLFAGQIPRYFSYYSLPWLIVAFVGTSQAGVFAACGAIIALVNPLVAAFNNVLMPRLATAFADGGRREVHRIVFKATVVLATVVGTFSAFTVLLGGYIVKFVFGSAYADNGHVLAVMALVPLLGVLVQSASQALFVLQRPRLTVAAQISGVLFAFPVTLVLVHSMGIFGAAVGHVVEATVVGAVTAIGYWMIMFRKTVPNIVPRSAIQTASDG